MAKKHYQTQKAVKDLLFKIDEGVWHSVSIQNIKKMSPIHAFKHNQHTIDSIGQMTAIHSTNYQIKSINCQNSPEPAEADKLRMGQMKMVVKQSKIKEKEQNVQSESNKLTKSILLNSKGKRILKQQRSQKESTKNKSAFFESKVKKSGSIIVDDQLTLIQLPRKQQDQMNEIEKLIQQRTSRQKQDANENNFIEIKKINAIENRKQKLKELKGLRKIFFDYQGNFAGVRQFIGEKPKITQLHPSFKEEKLLKIQQKPQPVQQNTIQNQRVNTRKIKLKLQKQWNQQTEKNCAKGSNISTFASLNSIQDGHQQKQQTINGQKWKNMSITQFKKIIQKNKFKQLRSLNSIKNTQKAQQNINLVQNNSIQLTNQKRSKTLQTNFHHFQNISQIKNSKFIWSTNPTKQFGKINIKTQESPAKYRLSKSKYHKGQIKIKNHSLFTQLTEIM